MDIPTLLIELAEKTGLLAAAALFAVLLPPLRNRLLGVGQPPDLISASLFGLALSMWGAKLGLAFWNEHVNVRTIGVLIAAILGGAKAGGLAGLGAGLFYALRVNPEGARGLSELVPLVCEGLLAGFWIDRAPGWFQGWRIFFTSMAIQMAEVCLSLGVARLGHLGTYVTTWPVELMVIGMNAAGVTLFVVVARLVVAREEARVALIEARAAADWAALEMLRRRLEPHFLFNALNTLRALIRTQPEKARELVADLADLYRYLLSHQDEALLKDEANHACAYVAIEQARLGEQRLRVENDIAEDVTHARVPALLLQPLVENAVKHGVAAHEGRGIVKLSAKREGDFVRIEVEDRSEGRKTHTPAPGTGMALTTLTQRLEKRFGGTATLELETTEMGARILVRLPWLPGSTEGRSKTPGFGFGPKGLSEGKPGTIKEGGEQKQDFCSSPEARRLEVR